MRQNNKFFLLAGALVFLAIIISTVVLLARNSPENSGKQADSLITLDYTGDNYRPVTKRIKAGSQVTLTIRSTIKDEVHFHGYNLSKPVAPGTPAVVSFKADKTGRFEVELEQSGKQLGYIEVYP